ncbi:MAG: pyrophosphatase PpaX [Bacillota bacterium]|nr:pyrophosphatase PpaX [Bacillota bacterium]
MINAILFDFDGTIIDTNDLIIQSYKHTLKTLLNINEETSKIVQYFGEPLAVTLSRYDNKMTEQLVNTYRTYNEKNHDELVKSIPGVKDAILKLKDSGVKLGIVTSKRMIQVKRGLEILEMTNVFDSIITPADTIKHKPEGEPALKCCELLGVLPEESLFVGDSHFDILCGKNAGCKTCVVSYSLQTMENLLKYKPDYVIDKIDDILKII